MRSCCATHMEKGICAEVNCQMKCRICSRSQHRGRARVVGLHMGYEVGYVVGSLGNLQKGVLQQINTLTQTCAE